MTKMRLVKAEKADFSKIKSAYIDIIDNTPDMEHRAKWEYGGHPSDESISRFIEDGKMFALMDGEKIAGVVEIEFSQGKEYHSVDWQIKAHDNEVVVMHLLGALPDYQGSGAGKILIEEIIKLAKSLRKKACRVDTFEMNTPAKKFYEKCGFKYCGKQRWIAENLGWMDFVCFEYVI